MKLYPLLTTRFQRKMQQHKLRKLPNAAPTPGRHQELIESKEMRHHTYVYVERIKQTPHTHTHSQFLQQLQSTSYTHKYTQTKVRKQNTKIHIHREDNHRESTRSFESYNPSRKLQEIFKMSVTDQNIVALISCLSSRMRS